MYIGTNNIVLFNKIFRLMPVFGLIKVIRRGRNMHKTLAKSDVEHIILDVLKNLAKLTGKHLCQSLFFNKDAG